MEAPKARFPRAAVERWTKERGDDKVVYGIEFKQDGTKFEADILEDGTIHDWEKAIRAGDLREAVANAPRRKCPGAELREVMANTAVEAGRGRLEGLWDRPRLGRQEGA